LTNILSVRDLTKTYSSGQNTLTVLQNINFDINERSTTAIVGPSGSGKTTLLGLCAGLDQATHGSVILNQNDLNELDEDQRALLRNKYVGFVFQNFQLLPTLTALENIMVPLELRRASNVKQRAMDLLDKVGLQNRASHYPAQLSGGEQQRISLARAFSNSPKILFADEPTGNLDAETGENVEKLLFDLNREAGTTLILVTHDLTLASKTQRIIHMKGGKLLKDEG
jgi:putative ABC transport system ATP-binding protein